MLEPWRIVSRAPGDDPEANELDLTFTPGAMHEQCMNLGLIRSRFYQPVGLYRGVMRLGGKEYRLEDVPGVAEDQDVLW